MASLLGPSLLWLCGHCHQVTNNWEFDDLCCNCHRARDGHSIIPQDVYDEYSEEHVEQTEAKNLLPYGDEDSETAIVSNETSSNHTNKSIHRLIPVDVHKPTESGVFQTHRLASTAQTEDYLFASNNPGGLQWESSEKVPFSVSRGTLTLFSEFGELKTAPRRRAYSPRRKAEVAAKRREGACEKHRRLKQRCSHPPGICETRPNLANTEVTFQGLQGKEPEVQLMGTIKAPSGGLPGKASEDGITQCQPIQPVLDLGDESASNPPGKPYSSGIAGSDHHTSRSTVRNAAAATSTAGRGGSMQYDFPSARSNDIIPDIFEEFTLINAMYDDHSDFDDEMSSVQSTPGLWDDMDVSTPCESVTDCTSVLESLSSWVAEGDEGLTPKAF